MKTWNLGIVGAGVIADFHAKAIKDIPNANLFAVCDVELERAQKLAKLHDCKAFGSYDEMFAADELDIVTIATPSGLHLEPSVAAAKAGKHVLCEKPIEITSDRIDAMIEAHKKSGTRLGGIFQSRFADSLLPLRNAIEQGRFGKITYIGGYVPWWRTDEYYEVGWRGTWKLDGGGALMNQSIHVIDMICYLMPPIQSLYAFTNTIGHPQIETEDTAAACLRFTNGALGIIYGTTSSYPGQSKRLEITGTKGTAVYLDDKYSVFEFADKRPEDKEVLENTKVTRDKAGASDPAAMEHKPHAMCIQSFLEAVETGQPYLVEGPEAKRSVEIILAIYKSAKEGKPIVFSK